MTRRDRDNRTVKDMIYELIKTCSGSQVSRSEAN
uniref:Uncharacterized protein n=1 Tax=virus sp. ctmTa7 TaxID=2828255 RepID=A0A8S5RCM1_9VIRU|nr:MAG TPA: hypothetical protein [virus sp. ctmTa7]